MAELSEIMRQLAERKEPQPREALEARLLSGLKGETAPAADQPPQAPPYCPEPTITENGVKCNAYRETLYRAIDWI